MKTDTKNLPMRPHGPHTGYAPGRRVLRIHKEVRSDPDQGGQIVKKEAAAL